MDQLFLCYRRELAFFAALALSSSLPALAEPQCAKDLFFDQLDAPAESIDTGFKYWIQLKRRGKLSFVDNRTPFYSGDEIRFRLVANIAGYAYVVLVKGSTGTSTVLFPNATEKGGRVAPGKQYSLPAMGYLRFDKHPGTETVRLVLSRKPVAAASLLERSDSNCAYMAFGQSGDKAIQTDNCLVAFGAAENEKVELEGNSSPKEEASGFAKDLVYVPGTRAPASSARRRLRTGRRPRRVTSAARKGPAIVNGAVTVINIDPDAKLGAVIELEHR